jgi:hypothetical protein
MGSSTTGGHTGCSYDTQLQSSKFLSVQFFSNTPYNKYVTKQASNSEVQNFSSEFNRSIIKY